MVDLHFPSPKLGAGDSVDTWYRYYAGYSSQFVEYALNRVAPSARTVLDPWNGTGTTTLVAANRSLSSYGFDINPAAVIVARARLLDSSVAASIQALTDHITAGSHPKRIPDDPLRFWFSDDSAAQIRSLQTSIHHLLVDSSGTDATPADQVEAISSLAAFFYVALFRTVRVLIAPAAGSNPTWWKVLPEDRKLRVPKRIIIATFAECSAQLGLGLHARASLTRPITRIQVGDSRILALPDNSVDAVISSPPYCTRIDYGVSMRPELAVLRYSEDQLRGLRHQMVGTPTMAADDLDQVDLGALGTRFLERVKRHPSQSSGTYYLRYFRQYYAAMDASLRELRRVGRIDAPVLLVVQDSFYKEVHNDTPAILAQMAKRAGFARATRYDFVVPRTKAAINPRTRKYRPVASATETVLLIR